MPATEMTPAALEVAAAAASTNDQPIFMLNLLRYNDQTTYAAGSGFAPCSGREAYFQRYVPAFGELAKGTGIKPFWIGNVFAGVVAPAGERWDDVAIVEYPSFDAFRKLVESDAYKTMANPHRLAALADWRLIATSQADLPG